MSIAIAIIVGILGGTGQFFLKRWALKPLAQGKDVRVARVTFLQFPIPILLLLGCAFVDAGLLPFAGGAFCLSLIVASVANHLITLKKKG